MPCSPVALEELEENDALRVEIWFRRVGSRCLFMVGQTADVGVGAWSGKPLTVLEDSFRKTREDSFWKTREDSRRLGFLLHRNPSFIRKRV